MGKQKIVGYYKCTDASNGPAFMRMYFDKDKIYRSPSKTDYPTHTNPNKVLLLLEDNTPFWCNSKQFEKSTKKEYEKQKKRS